MPFKKKGRQAKLQCKTENHGNEGRLSRCWPAFRKNPDILSTKLIPLSLKKLVENQCVLPVRTYVAENGLTKHPWKTDWPNGTSKEEF